MTIAIRANSRMTTVTGSTVVAFEVRQGFAVNGRPEHAGILLRVHLRADGGKGERLPHAEALGRAMGCEQIAPPLASGCASPMNTMRS